MSEAETLLERFKDEYSQFPFVVIGSLTLAILRRDRPFLLIAILATTTHQRANLHKVLESEFRTILGTKVFVDGVFNVDLLQGLVVYLSWWHFHRRQANQIFTITQTAVTIALDLAETVTLNAEWKRLYLGTYLLSSCILFALGRTPVMKYDDIIDRYCRGLATQEDVPTDLPLVHAVRLHRLVVLITSAFGRKSHRPFELSEGTTELLIDSFKSQLQDLRSTLRLDDSSIPSLGLMYDSAYVFLYEVALYTNFQGSETAAPDHQSLGTTHNSQILETSLLFNCLEATKNFLSRYLRLSGQLIRKHSMCEKAQLGHAIMVLIKLSLCATGSHEGLRFRQTCDVKYFLDALANRAATLTAATLGTTEYPDCFWQFEQTIRRIKCWYEHLETGQQGATPTDFIDASPLRLVSLSEEFLQETPSFNDLDLTMFNSADFWQ
ncbi:uncharacterized protein A1O9_01007 [Exophiala aquamarina CBS 119918]|uniref:Transcription factor domain-containing protein n=1 Tax=Exophiala aquamarina CBS 119918 TaxID=1182545 RepID=A0A072PT26_9EURO|nr:uncharacterized protein A1O9_01007 [Exophiala aquamarina CBS 119918]KEF63031.1 hypothetical protein A1O9_01007 [Exophiala aquamarina CBS 119918]